MPNYRMVLFDSDGTLANTLPWVSVAFNQLAAKYGFPEAPTRTPAPGEGLVYTRPVRDRTAAGLLLACLVLGIVLSKRLNCAVLLASRRRRAAAAERAEAASRRPESVVPKPHLGRLVRRARREGSGRHLRIGGISNRTNGFP